MHKRGLCRHAVSVCPSVCLSRSWVASKQIKISSNFSPSGSQAILVFHAKRDGDIPRGTPHNGGVDSNAGGVGKKTRSWTNIWLCCIQVYSVINRTSREVWTIKPRRTAASVEPSTHRGVCRPLFAQDDDEVFVTGSTLYAGDGGQPPTGHNPLGHNPVICCSRTSWDKSRRVFLLKTDTNPYSWPNPTHEAGSSSSSSSSSS